MNINITIEIKHYLVDNGFDDYIFAKICLHDHEIYWDSISEYDNYPEWFIVKYKNFFNWSILSWRYTFSNNFLLKYFNYINWDMYLHYHNKQLIDNPNLLTALQLKGYI